MNDAPELPGEDDPSADATLKGELDDDLLRMIFVVCHPELPIESQIALALRTLFGLEIAQIAKLYLAQESAVEKRLVRARQTLRDARVSFDLPASGGLEARVDDVLRCLYMLFGEGYAAHGGERAIREDLCREAIRLATIVARDEHTASPRSLALLAWMDLLAARLGAREDEHGNLLTLAEQDRSRWDRAGIARGLARLAAASRGNEISEYHLEAGIVACNSIAPTMEATDWRRIVGYYDRLLERQPSPVIRLNRAVALGYAEGPSAALREIETLSQDPRLSRLGLLPAATADLLAKTGDRRRAQEAYERALPLAANEQERALLQRRIAELF